MCNYTITYCIIYEKLNVYKKYEIRKTTKKEKKHKHHIKMMFIIKIIKQTLRKNPIRGSNIGPIIW